MGRAKYSSYIDNSLAIDCAFWIYNHDRLLNITHDQIHMSVICLDCKSERFLGMIKGETYVKYPSQFSLSSQLDENSFTQG